MHYKNGRPAKSGDKVAALYNGNLVVGILHTLNADSKTCNGRVAVTTQSDPYVTVGDCLHVDDIVAATIPDSTAK